MSKKIVVIGGGHGSSVILSGLKDSGADLTAILAMADNGGSTGRLRNEYGVSAVGDIRNCLAALCDDSELADLFSYRFSSGKLEGHSLGNLFLAAGELSQDGIQESIDFARQALGIKAEIFPVTLDNTQLVYRSKEKQVIGMHEIAKISLDSKPNLSLEPSAKLSPQAKNSILEADLVVIAPGNFYCSISQTLLVGGMADALENSLAKVVMVANLVNIDRHNLGFSPVDYLNELNRFLGKEIVSYIIYNSEEIVDRILKEGESQVLPPQQAVNKVILRADDLVDKTLAQADPNDKIAFIRSRVRHDKKKLAKIILAL